MRWRQDGTPAQRSFETREQAESFAAELEGSLEAHRAAVARRSAMLTVSDAVDAYYQRRKRHLQLSTQHHYEHLIARYIEPAIGSCPVRQLSETPATLQDFYDDLPPTTAAHCHQILRPAFQYAVDHRQLDRNPCSVARPSRRRRPEKLIPTADEVAKIALIAAERNDRFGLFVWLVSRLGLRRGEACALRWEDFRAEQLEVRIRRTIARKSGGTYIKLPKSGEARTLRMDRRFFEKVQPMRQPQGWLFPRGYNSPYRNENGITEHSTAGRFISALQKLGGELRAPGGKRWDRRGGSGRSRKALGSSDAASARG